MRQGTPWDWVEPRETAFTSSKQIFLKAGVLVHYDVDLPITLPIDASPCVVGAVIDDKERPVAFASRTLTASERNYSQLESEALALIYGVKHFHQYIYGCPFTLVTDHKPLMTILGPKTGVPTMAAARLQRWALTLSTYRYEIQYHTGVEHGNADCFSRLLCPGIDQCVDVEDREMFHTSLVHDIPVTSKDIAAATAKDMVLARVYSCVMNGWPSKADYALKPYAMRQSELSVENCCILWGIHVITPPPYQERLLNNLHETHPGKCHMKSTTRNYLWWPCLNQDIADRMGGCEACQAAWNLPSMAPLHYWT